MHKLTCIAIFSDNRQSELHNYFTAETTVILAWGNVKPIRVMEGDALGKISKLTKRLVSARADNQNIYHPSPPIYDYKIRWLDTICGCLKALDNSIHFQEQINTA